MRQLRWLVLGLAFLGLTHAPLFGQPKKEDTKKAEPARPSFKHLDGQMLVFVANGAGGSTLASDNLIQLNGEKQFHLRIHTVHWCRHNGVLQDLRDQQAQIDAAARLACSVDAIRKDAPNAQIFFLGHSTGTRVVLAAAEMLPAKSVDRIILLSSAVSSGYDLTKALQASRHGIDNFYSAEDGMLPLAEERGTADGVKGPTAGRVGFRLCSTDKKDIEAYRSLRQVGWTDKYFGHGGHATWLWPRNLDRVIVPLFFTAPAEVVVVEPKKTKGK